MSNRLTNPYIQFLNNTGGVLAGGTLQFYVTGTTTPTSTYSDAALTTPNTNPITLNSAGRSDTSVFLDSTITYKLVLKDSGGSTIWTADPVVDLGANINAKVQVYAGNPNGNVAGDDGTPGGAGASMVYDTTNGVLYICTTTGTATTAVWTALSNTFTGAEDIKTNDYTVVAADDGRVQVANKASAITFTLTAVATIGAGFLLPVKNIGAGTLTLDPSGAETIDGAATVDLTINQGLILYCNGSTWRILAKYDATAGTISGTALTLTSTDAGAAVGPTVTLYRNSATPAASDLLGQHLFQGEDSAGNTQDYADIVAKILDPTTATEDAAILLRAVIAGTLTDIITAGPGVQIGTPTGGDKGANTLNANGVYDTGFRTGMVLLTSGTVSAAATLDLDLTGYTAYRGLKFVLSGFLPATDGAILLSRFSTDGGSSYDASGYNVAATVVYDDGTTAAVTSGSTTSIVLSQLVGSASTEGVNAEITLLNQTSTAIWSRITFSSFAIDNSATPLGTSLVGGGAREAAQNTDAVRILFSTGNIAAGNYAVYGLL